MNGKELCCYFILRKLARDECISISGKDLEVAFSCDRKIRTTILKSLVEHKLIRREERNGNICKYEILKSELFSLTIPQFIMDSHPIHIKKLACVVYINLSDYLATSTVKKAQELLQVSKDTIWRFNNYAKENELMIDKKTRILAKNDDVTIKKLAEEKLREEAKWIELGDKTSSELTFYNCNECNTYKSNHYFYKYNNRRCKKCLISYSKEQCAKQNFSLDDPENFFKQKLMKIKSSAKSREIGFDLTAEDLLEIYEQQKKVCYYTGITFNIGNKEETISVDRLNSDKDYTKDNIVLCLNAINTMKSNITGSKFKKYITAIDVDKIQL